MSVPQEQVGPWARAEIVEGGVFIPTSGVVQSAAIKSLVIVAPDLLAALKAMVARFYRGGGALLTADAVVRAEAAIARAEGREG